MQPKDGTAAVNNNCAQTIFLVVEDNNDIWIIISMLFKRQLPGVHVHRVVNAQQALDYLDKTMADQQPLPKVILQNLYLPLLQDGLELLQGIRSKLSDFAAQQIPILVMSSSDVRSDIRSAYQAGATSYYLKPTNISHWVTYFDRLRQYWLESVILPVS